MKSTVIHWLLPTVMILVNLIAGSRGQDGGGNLENLKSQFEVQLKEVDAVLQEFDERYAGELKKLEQQATGKGQLELVLAVRKEAEDFADRKALEKPSGHPELARLQKIYTEKSAEIAADAQKKLSELADAHIKKLDALKIDLTKAHRIKEAVAVQAEAKRVQQLVAAGVAVPNAGNPDEPPDSPETGSGSAALIGHWTFDDDGKDSSGHGHNARLVGAEIVEGHIGKGALKTGKGFAEVLHDASFNLQHPFTLSLWAYREPKVAQSSLAFLFVKYGKTWTVGLDGDGQLLGFSVGVSDSRDLAITLEEGVIRDGRWHHVAAVFDGTSTALFIDGRERESWEGDDELSLRTSGGNLQIGGVANGTRNFHGMLDDLRIYKGVLTKNEIQDLSKEPEEE